jgi:hypothetical protein
MGNGHVDQGSARRAEAHRESGNRDSRGHKHHVIESANSRRVKSRWDLNRWIKH